MALIKQNERPVNVLLAISGTNKYLKLILYQLIGLAKKR